MGNSKRSTGDKGRETEKFGAFKGVFTPSILTILGVIMYLRFGWVVGHGGILGAILVVILAHVISFTTGMSVSSIATNRTVKTGGDYYMISRSLGLPIGGAIGIALFFALALSMSLYIIGFSESFLATFQLENSLPNRQIVGSAACAVITTITFISTSLALRIQYFVLAAIVLSLVSLALGYSPSRVPENIPWWFQSDSESFETMFAVFFPAVTGFTAGVAMSGDLQNPRKAIPRGTMAAVSIGLAIYLLIPVFLGFTAEREALRTDQMVWMQIARFPALVVAGVFAATISSAMGSILGAPRYLQALARDGVVPRIFSKGYGDLDEPRLGTIATFVVAEAGILLGELNLVARIITMFFLTSYGFICFASGIQSWSGISSFRPDFKTHYVISFVGALTCLAIMFKLDALALFGSTAVMGFIFLILRQRQFRTSPGDNWGGFWAAVVQKGLLNLHTRAADSKNWRPNTIVFGGEPSKRQHLVHLAKWIVQERGLCTYFYLIEGDVRKLSENARNMEPATRETVDRIYPEMLARVAVAGDVYEGIVNVAQSYGLSGMTPNTVLMGWGEETRDKARFTNLIRGLSALDHNLLFLEHDENWAFGRRQSIDIWWGGSGRNGELMILLAYMLTSAEEWREASVRINVIVDDREKGDLAQNSLNGIIAKTRVRARANVIVRTDSDSSIPEMVRRVSGNTDLVIMGLRSPLPEETNSYIDHVSRFIDGLGSVLLVHASTAFDGRAVLFDET